jgi:hypothetical protein
MDSRYERLVGFRVIQVDGDRLKKYTSQFAVTYSDCTMLNIFTNPESHNESNWQSTV